MIRILRHVHTRTRLNFLIEFEVFVGVTIFILALAGILMIRCMYSDEYSYRPTKEEEKMWYSAFPFR